MDILQIDDRTRLPKNWVETFSPPAAAAKCKEWDREAKLQLDILFFVSMTPLSQYIGTDEEIDKLGQFYCRDKLNTRF